MKVLTKLLSANDVGRTGSHQAGVLIPRSQAFLGFFPSLNASILNPSALLAFTEESGRAWMFRFIFYNNRAFGGTRNEYRLTRMTKFLRAWAASPGDGLVLAYASPSRYYAQVVKAGALVRPVSIKPDAGNEEMRVERFKSYALTFDENWSLTTLRE